MPKSYSLDLRERILKSYEEGVPVEDLVLQCSVSRSAIYSYLKQHRETGTMVVDGAINGELFLAYVEQELVKTLKEGDIRLVRKLQNCHFRASGNLDVKS